MRHVILNLHGVGTSDRPIEPGEAPYWISENLLRAALDIAQEYEGQLCCDFTIDDGNLSDATIVAPLLAERGLTAQIFVLTGRLGRQGFLDAAALSDLLAMKQTIGSHGRDHVDWTRLDSVGRTQEIHDPRRILADLTGQPVEAIGLPFGRYNRSVLAEIRRAGFVRCYSSDGGAAHLGAWPIARTSLRNDMTPADLRALITGSEPVQARLVRRLKGAVKRLL